MTPAGRGPRRRSLRKAMRRVPTGRRATRKVVTTYGHRQRERDAQAAFSEFCAQRRAMQEGTA
jgi:hypothetical protein